MKKKKTHPQSVICSLWEGEADPDGLLLESTAARGLPVQSSIVNIQLLKVVLVKTKLPAWSKSWRRCCACFKCHNHGLWRLEKPDACRQQDGREVNSRARTHFRIPIFHYRAWKSSCHTLGERYSWPSVFNLPASWCLVGPFTYLEQAKTKAGVRLVKKHLDRDVGTDLGEVWVKFVWHHKGRILSNFTELFYH